MHLAQFLHYLYRHLNAENVSKHHSFFDDVDAKLNSFSASLAMTSQGNNLSK